MYLYVPDPPGQPILEPTSATTLVVLQRATFECSSSGGYPAPTFIWTIDGEILPQTSYNPSAGGNSTSQVQLDLTYEHNGKVLRCEATNELRAKSKTVSKTLDVKCK